ncbi:polysaccharide pyruvyl transferase family protein [Saccharopolyspora sp. NFXS83]|uniref:polysaccharide pyruvyl transferase family protein n=1 Tax=Saccharopolyspora sp. NFXS83 TaxID=2993560 RepID=UPI00224B563F|nr:polysaccharide pyruvyl transferase family protein [Saccharopolyspora sp. NFXS83]MCX2729990.1 polysaccharide pyruvyl transferase family protein [Saccharopolyspora sp. NFXS83]
MRVLITGWPSFLHAEVNAGDVAAMRRVEGALTIAGIPCDTAWSPTLAPGSLTLDDAAPEKYTDLVFVSGPAHGRQLDDLHRRYDQCRRTAVGVTVIDERSTAVQGFHSVLARDRPQVPASRDLAAGAPTSPAPVAAIVVSHGRREYGPLRRHDSVHRYLLNWIGRTDFAPMPIDPRLDRVNARACSTVDQFAALLARADVVVTSRLSGLVFALAQGVPALAVDPVAGGGKVSAQGMAWQWPAVLSSEEVISGGDGQAGALLDRWWQWCLGPEAREQARTHAAQAAASGQRQLSDLVDHLRTPR